MQINEILNRFDRVRHSGSQWTSRCPAHEDRDPSLSIAEGEGGRILFWCFAGCEVGEIVEAVGLRLCDLFLEDADKRSDQRPRPHLNESRIIAHWVRETSGRIAEMMRESGQRENLARRILRQLGNKADRPLLQGEIERNRREWEVLETLHEDLADPALAVELYRNREILQSVLGAIG